MFDLDHLATLDRALARIAAGKPPAPAPQPRQEVPA
jgi:hypothetical protein